VGHSYLTGAISGVIAHDGVERVLDLAEWQRVRVRVRESCCQALWIIVEI